MFKRVLTLSLALFCATLLSGCLSLHSYVDNSLGDPRYADLKKPETPQPIQLLFEFQSKGVANARATSSVRPKVFEEVSRSKLFSEVSYEPVASGRRLSISISNIPLTENAAAKGFGTGLTLGLAGSTVADGYVCNISYTEPGQEAVTTEVKHSIVSTIGNASGPQGLTQMTPVEAVDKVVRQMIGKGLADLVNKSDISK